MAEGKQFFLVTIRKSITIVVVEVRADVASESGGVLTLQIVHKDKRNDLVAQFANGDWIYWTLKDEGGDA